MTPLWRAAQERQREAAALGFDWPDLDGVLAKLREELAELEDATQNPDATQRVAQCRHELGDLLFVLAHLSRRLEVDPESALNDALARFNARFSEVMRDAEQLPPLGNPARLDAMEARWQAAKRRGL
ncbi:MazG nucleotide pyrophosphohydrolase domain-containing protein [Algiphilus sp.]|uniref:MazG nucleotide pyrophosphohydrolase domain-containing protein n=1 Tax=Algiphilus sp. TaxID=1872431 RepID=UPI003B5233BC